MSEQSLVKYEISGGEAFGQVKIFLERPGQQIISNGGAMIYMTGNIQYTTKSTGGLLKGLKRTFAHESMFQDYFELAPGDQSGSVTFAPHVPGSVIHLHLNQNEGWTLSDGAYLCSTASVQISTRRGGFKQMFVGEGYFLVDLTTQADGDVWLGSYGYIERHELQPGEELVVDRSTMLAFQTNMENTFTKIGSTRTLILGGEGFAIKYRGPGVVYTQNRSIHGLAAILRPFFPAGK